MLAYIYVICIGGNASFFSPSILHFTNRSKYGAQSKKQVLLILTWKQISVVWNIILVLVFMWRYASSPYSTLVICPRVISWILHVNFQVGSADHHIHYFDLRNTSAPLHVLRGHRKAVSYVKFLSTNELASASTDSTLRLWDVKENCQVCTTKQHSELNCLVF